MALTVTLCRSPDDSLAALRAICDWADELHLAYAWASSMNGTAAHWKALPLAKVRRAIIGTQFAQTEPAALALLASETADVLRVVEDTGGVFHPKVIIGLKGNEARALIGSSNFTNGGFSGNTELNVWLNGDALEGPLADALSFIDQQWTHPRALVPDGEWLARYSEAHAARPRPKPLKGASSVVVLQTESDLDIEWSEYFRLIEQQERRMLSTGTPIHVFDHRDASYLQEIETCQAHFRRFPSFAAMPLDERKFVSGFGGTSGYFGRMVGAGHFKNMVIERPAEIGVFVDAIPTAGTPTDQQVSDYVEGVTAIRGVSLGTATRLLIAKRPDIFVPVNGANSDRIKQLFGAVPKRAEQYIELLKRIWAMPWFQVEAPTTEHQLRVWRVRVAILDAVMYETKSGSGPVPFAQ